MRALFCALVACSLAPAQVLKVPAGSPEWFPSDKAELSKALDRSFTASKARTRVAPLRKGLLAFVAPHASIGFSGTVASSAYSRLSNPHNIIVLGFSHNTPHRGILAPAADAYSTPLGEVPVNRKALRDLGIREVRIRDHSLENQLPFIARIAPKAGVIPLYVGELNPAELQTTARKLAARLEQGDVIVASSDLTHYGEGYGYRPFSRDMHLPKRLRERAVETFEQIGTLNPAEFDQFLARTGDTLCGRNPIRLMMATLAHFREPVYMTAEDYLNSGDLTGDYSTSVGYGALAFYPASAFGVEESDQKKLLASARATIEAYLASGKKTAVPVNGVQPGSALEQRGGVFVTIKKNGKLRGCIGSLSPSAPLWAAVSRQTLAAATEDPRFEPLKRGEGPVMIEVSLLTPLKRIASWREFQLGFGAAISLKGKSGLLLPQVAKDMGWTTREQFLENLALKAGLPRTAYRDSKATLFVYSAQVFSETDLP